MKKKLGGWFLGEMKRIARRRENKGGKQSRGRENYSDYGSGKGQQP